MDRDILIDEDGDIKFVYDDELAAVFDGEAQETKRASHVEPHPCGGGWLADMRPSGGPILGANDWLLAFDESLEFLAPVFQSKGIHGFATRAEALAAEREWLRKEKDL